MPEQTEKKLIKVPAVVRVGEFAELLDLPVTQVISELMKNGVLATINEMIDFDTASILADTFGYEVSAEEQMEVSQKTTAASEFVSRPPVVTVMGHVDHGKTSILDAIRESKVAKSESGGITQAIGAYQAEIKNKKITFIDTPGHEAFSAMRAHGANVTDVVVLVVAADDGVKPQTLEAVSLARSAGVPIVVAINKMDAPGANKDKVMQELAGVELVPEEWGGKTIMVGVSAKTKEGLDKLLEMILLVADLKDLKAAANVPASGVVIESKLDPGKGPVATILIQNGVLKEGDIIQTGGTYGRVRAMDDYRGKKMKEAGASMPVRISGLKEIPQVADFMQVFDSEQSARGEATAVKQQRSAKKIYSVKKMGVDELTRAVKLGELKELNIVLKTDVQGSLNALVASIEKIKNEEVMARIVHRGVGEISESDIASASTASAVIFGFRVGVSPGAKSLAQKEKVAFSVYDVIYELLDDIKKGLSALLTPLRKETEVGSLKILKVFKTGKSDSIVGGKVVSGKVVKGINVQVLRGTEVVASGRLDAVQREKDEVPEMSAGSEAGLHLVGVDQPKLIKEGDSVRVFSVEEIQRTL